MSSESTPVSNALTPATNFFALGADLLGEVQRIIGTNRVRGLRLKLGNRTLTEIEVGQLTAAATIGVVLLAVIISTMTIEVEQEPAASPA